MFVFSLRERERKKKACRLEELSLKQISERNRGRACVCKRERGRVYPYIYINEKTDLSGGIDN